MTAQRTERWPFPGSDALPEPRTPQQVGVATVTVTRGPLVAAPLTVPITSDVVTVGRHPDCDIVLDDMTVSRTHAELRRTGDRITITDLGSLNGTYVNREPVDHAALADGDTIWIGKYRLSFRARAAVAEPALAGAR